MRKFFLIFSGLVVVFCNCLAQSDKADKRSGRFLFPAAEDPGHYGYINAKGDVMLPPVYQAADYFYQSLAAVKKDGKYGFIDFRGNWIVKPQYDSVMNFSEGLAAVGVKGNDSVLSWGYIDTTGAVLETNFPALCRVTSFHENRAVILACSDQPLNYHIINRSGEIAIKLADNNYLDETVYPEFHEGYMRIILPDNSKTFIDTSGNLWNKGTYQDLGDFSEGLAWFMDNGLYGYINKEGKIVIPATFQTVSNFSNGLAKIIEGQEYDPGQMKLTGGKVGYINNKGKEVISPQYDDGNNFNEGLALVKQGKYYGYINNTGALVINFQFTDAKDFLRGLACVHDDKRWQFINKLGDKVW